MKKLYLGLLILLFSLITTFGQVSVDIGEVNDSVATTFNFCLIEIERSNGLVKMQCGDINGTTMYIHVREDYFHGKMTIVIMPNEEDGPITEDRVINWFLLPENDTTKIIE